MMQKQPCPKCSEMGNAEHISNYGECERCTLKAIQAKKSKKE